MKNQFYLFPIHDLSVFPLPPSVVLFGEIGLRPLALSFTEIPFTWPTWEICRLSMEVILVMLDACIFHCYEVCCRR